MKYVLLAFMLVAFGCGCAPDDGKNGLDGQSIVGPKGDSGDDGESAEVAFYTLSTACVHTATVYARKAKASSKNAELYSTLADCTARKKKITTLNPFVDGYATGEYVYYAETLAGSVLRLNEYKY